MLKKYSKLFLSLFVAVLMVGVLCLTKTETTAAKVFPDATAADIVASGKCGENLTWSLDNKDTLTISGTGEMENYLMVACPWSSARESIKKVIIGNSVTSVGAFSFTGCISLADISIGQKVATIGTGAFADCYALKNIDLPDSVTTIAGNAFSYSGIEDLIIPDSVTSIGNYAFSSCKSLKSVTLSNSVTSMGNGVFYYCVSLVSATIRDSVTEIGPEMFAGCSALTDISIPETVTSIGRMAFELCGNLKTISIPDSVTSIDGGAFAGCTSLESIDIPNSVTCINDDTFLNCRELKSVSIPETVTSIGFDAFLWCDNLSDIYYGGTKEQWSEIDIDEHRESIDAANIHFHGEHKNTKTVAEVKATCSKVGYTAGIYCNDCGRYASGHKEIAINSSAHKYTNACDKSCNVCKATRTIKHTYKTVTTKATLKKNGKVETKCSVCGYVSKTTTVYYPKTIKLSKTEYTYNGKVQTPSVTVKDSKGNTLKNDTDFTVKYESGRKAPGKYTVTITFKGKYSGTKKLTYTIAPKATSKVTATQTTTTITLKWNKVTGAEGYRIYQYNTKTKKYEKVKDVTGTSLKISKLKAGTKYKFKVRAFTKDDGTIMGAYSPIFETATKAKTPTLKVTSTKKGTAALSWSNVTGESGYQVYYATKKNGEYKKVDSYKVNVVKGSKSKLTSGKTYYFKVRAYTKTDSGTVYSAWSTVKSVKVK